MRIRRRNDFNPVLDSVTGRLVDSVTGRHVHTGKGVVISEGYACYPQPLWVDCNKLGKGLCMQVPNKRPVLSSFA